MDNSEEKKPLITQSWLRVLLFIITCSFITVLIAIPAIIFLTETKAIDLQKELYRTFSSLTSIDHLWIAACVELIASLFTVFVFRKFIDRKSFTSMGISGSGQMNNIIAGFFLAPAIIGSGSLILYFSGHLEWDDFVFDTNRFFIQTGILVFIAFSEELVFRGYILNNLLHSYNRWLSLIISSILFTLFHLSNPGIGVIPLMTLFLAGILFGLNYIYTQSLWFSFMLHFSWNLFQGPVSGYKISGIDFISMLQIQLKGDASITGGDFGFEGSFIATTLLSITLAIMYIFYERRYKNE